MKNLKNKIEQAVRNGYAFEVMLRNIMLIVAAMAVLLGLVVLLTGW